MKGWMPIARAEAKSSHLSLGPATGCQLKALGSTCFDQYGGYRLIESYRLILPSIYLSNFLKETHRQEKSRKESVQSCTKQPVSARNHLITITKKGFLFLNTALGSKEHAKLQNGVNKRILKKGSFTTAHNARIRAGPIMRKSITGFRPNRSESRPKLGLRKNSTTLPRE